MDDTDQWLTATQAREAYGISTERMKRMLADGVIPFTSSPLRKGAKYIKRSDMEAWKASLNGLPLPRHKTPRTDKAAKAAP